MLRDIVDRLEGAARRVGSIDRPPGRADRVSSQRCPIGSVGTARERYSELHEVTMTTGGFVELHDLFDVELLAWRGDGQTPVRAAQLREAGTAVHTQVIVHWADLALSIFALGEGRYETALTAAQAVAEAGTTGWACQALPLVVEAGMRCGEREAASGALTVLAERATASGTPWALGLLARCRALVADGSSAAALYNEALDHLGKTSWLTEVAQTHLLYGEWLRRKKRRSRGPRAAAPCLRDVRHHGSKGVRRTSPGRTAGDG